MTECEYSGRRCFLIPQTVNLGINQCSDHLEPDGHTYLRCDYFSNRTRLRCNSVRCSDDLRPHGYCEKHNGYIRRIRREALRARRILDPEFLKENDIVLDESSDDNFDEALERTNRGWPYVFETLYCDTRIDDPDNPLRNAGVYTPKEIVNQYIDALERKKEALRGMRQIYAEKHRRLMIENLARCRDNNPGTELLSLTNSEAKNERLREKFRARAKYGRPLEWRRSIYYLEKVAKRNSASDSTNSAASATLNAACQHVERVARNRAENAQTSFNAGLKEDDSAKSIDSVVRDLLTRVVDFVDAHARPTNGGVEERVCNAPRIPLTDFCAKHVLLASSQVLFTKCIDCDGPAILFSEYHRCKKHYDKLMLGTSTRSSSTNASDSIMRSVTIGDDLDSDAYLRMCVNMARAEQPPPAAVVATTAGGGGTSHRFSTTLAGPAYQANHPPPPPQQPQHQQPHAGAQFYERRAPPPVVAGANVQRYARVGPPGNYARVGPPGAYAPYMDIRYGRPGAFGSDSLGAAAKPTTTESCARVRPFVGKCRDRKRSFSSSSSSVRIFSSQSPGSSAASSTATRLSPKASQSGSSHGILYSPSSQSPRDSSPSASFGDRPTLTARHHSPPTLHHQSVGGMALPRRIPPQISAANPAGGPSARMFSYPKENVQHQQQRHSMAMGMGGVAPTRATPSALVRVVRGNQMAPAAGGGPPIAKIARRSAGGFMGRPGGGGVANSTMGPPQSQLQQPPAVYQNTDDYVQQQFERPHQNHPQPAAYHHQGTPVYAAPPRAFPRTTFVPPPLRAAAGERVVSVLRSGAGGPPPLLSHAEAGNAPPMGAPPQSSSQGIPESSREMPGAGAMPTVTRFGKAPVSILSRRRESHLPPPPSSLTTTGAASSSPARPRQVTAARPPPPAAADGSGGVAVGDFVAQSSKPTQD